MCLALPAKVVELLPDDQARVDLGGVQKEISLALVDGVALGDYVILHVGYALTRLDPEEAERTLALFAELGAEGAGEPGQTEEGTGLSGEAAPAGAPSLGERS